MKVLKEFGFYNYYILPGEGNNALILTMGFSAKDFDKIYDYVGKEFLEAEYKEFECIPKCTLSGLTFDLAIKVNLEKYQKAYEKKSKKMSEEEKEKFDEERKEIRAELEKFAKLTAEKLSNFRVKIYCAALEKMLREVKDKAQTKQQVKPLTIHLNEKNILHMIPLVDNVMLVYGVDFQQSTDQSLARVFLQELKEAKNHVKNCIAGNVYCEMDETPKILCKLIILKNTRMVSLCLIYS
jgi:hypothetical protein